MNYKVLAQLALTNEELGVLVRLLARQDRDGSLPPLETLTLDLSASAELVRSVTERAAHTLSHHRAIREKRAMAGSKRQQTAANTSKTQQNIAIASPDGPAPSPDPIPTPLTPIGKYSKARVREDGAEFKPDVGLLDWAAKWAPKVDLPRETEQWRDHWQARGWRTKEGPITNLAASWRAWIRNAAKWASERNGNRRNDSASASQSQATPRPAPAGKFRVRTLADLKASGELPTVPGKTSGGSNGAL